ncbi:Cell wall-associated polypeptide CWBP200 [Porphyromonas macacae]|uniref:Cell wall-associated polypeptide CWBP200 n=2 Tax=Porphyromonas macacae TaxID=28115 RepID=A0A379EA92_9PORP|nr:RHS repeat-associated core domain-containing protein [Porphyromonas macacae]SUB89292.1 Cell wall-associated polypeptide CWBP200 [Porphyromonas macacae]
MSIGRDRSGLEIQRELSGGVSVTTGRDMLGRTVRRDILSGGVEQSRMRYRWSMGNRLHRKENELTGESVHFGYDSWDNLFRADYRGGSEVESIYKAPDALGNLFRTEERKDRKYGKGGRLLEDRKFAYRYDGEGNLVLKSRLRPDDGDEAPQWQEGDWAYEWQGNGMLKSVKRPDGEVVSFEYDPLGRRISKTYKDRTTRWVWDGNVPLHEWTDDEKREGAGDENLITWLFEEGSFVPTAKIVGNKAYSIITDYLGTPTHAFDSKGDKIWERELDIYGKAREGDSSFIPFLFQGQYFDEETDLCYNRFRYYSPDTGSYISQDPILVLGGFNLYSYVRDLNIYVDTFGWWSELLSSGMGHHLFPRSVAKKLGISELSQNNSIAWYPNNPKGSDVLHGEMHSALSKEGIPFHGSKFEGTTAEAFDKMKKAYAEFDEKGFLKIPGTDEKLFKNLTPGEAIDKIKEQYESGKLKGRH